MRDARGLCFRVGSAIALLSAAPAAAAPPPPVPIIVAPPPIIVAPPSPSAHVKAGRLAQVAIDASRRADINVLLNSILAVMEREQSGIAELELAFPGLKLAVRDAIRPVMQECQEEIWPQYHDDLEALYVGEMTEDEMDSALAFYASPVFTKLAGGIARQQDYAAVSLQIAGDNDVKAQDVAKDVRLAALRSAADLNAEERADVRAFSVSPAGRKVNSLMGRKMEIDAKWMNYSTPELETRIEVATINSMIAHIEKTDPAFAKAMRKEFAKEREKRKAKPAVEPNT